MYPNTIEIPELNDQDLITCYAQLRPSRQGGPRVQRENTHGKAIVHNYGHGGAGISLSPATALEAVNLIPELLKPNLEIAIIGSGVVGLMTAHQLLQREPSAKITLFAEQIPTFCNKNNNSVITSEVAPGFWLPYLYGSTDEQQHLKRASYAFNWYTDLSKKQQYKPFAKQVMFFDLSDDQEEGDVQKYLTPQIMPSLNKFYLTLNSKTKVKCTAFKTLKLDLQPLLLIFKTELTKKGVKFVQKTITKQTLKDFKETVVFNCSGLGSKVLFDDNTMSGKKGHLVEYKNRKPQKYNYLMRANVGSKRMSYYMHDSRILIGRTIETEQNREVNDKVVKEIQEIHRLILQKFNLLKVAPKL